MEKSVEVLVGMAGLAVTALAAFAVYRWGQRNRARRVQGQVEDYLSARYGGLPGRLDVNCSDDPHWPVLVGFDDPRTGARHRLQFACWGPPPAFSLLSEVEDRR